MKRLLSLSVCSLLILGFVTGCGDKGTSNTDTSTRPEAEVSAQTSTNTNENVEHSMFVGQEYTFGTYEQDGDKNNGAEPIEWKVLAVEDGKALLVSKYVLDWKQYNESGEKTNWSNCSLRTWLNKDFYNEAFTQEEINRIADTTITSDGEETVDLVFLLNKTEMETYFNNDDARISEPTEETKLSANDTQNSTFENKEGCWYWACGNGTLDRAPYVSKAGKFEGKTDPVDSYSGVRPAVWINVD